MSHDITKVEPLASINWFKEGWDLFTKSWIAWIVGFVVIFIFNLILGVIPFIGALLFAALMSAVAVAVMLALRQVDSSGTIDWQLVQRETQARLNPILLLALINIGIMFVISVVLGAMAFGSVAAGGTVGTSAGVAGGLLTVLVGLLGIAVSACANFFAAPLIAFSQISAVDAVKTSFQACLANIPALAIFGVIAFVLGLIAMIPFGLGLLVLWPVVFGAVYSAVKQIFPSIAPPVTVLPKEGAM